MGIAGPAKGCGQPGLSPAPGRQSSAAMAAKMMLQRKSILELAEDSGLFAINPSDLVYEIHPVDGPTYYDFVLSCSAAGPSKRDGCCLYLAKFDSKVNLDSFESVRIPGSMFDNGLPESDIALMTLGILTWREQVAKSKVLCLVRSVEVDCTSSLEALKKAANKYRCQHHVQATSRRDSTSSTSSTGSTRSGRSEGMKMRVLLCQSRQVLEEVPAHAIRDTKALLNPAGNMLACVCFNMPNWMSI